MAPEDFLAVAEQHAEAGRFSAAVAYASIATARAAVVTAARQADPIYPGDHQPLPADWCGKCHSPGRRRIDQKDCPRCSSQVLRARLCRYCGVYLEKRLDAHGSEESWAWRDERNSLNCPKAPDPSVPSPAPVGEEHDVNPDHVWALFFQEWKDHRALAEPASAAELLATSVLMPYVPRTRFGERPHAEHLEAWLAERATKPHGLLQLAEEAAPESPSVRAWRLTSL